MALIVEDGTGLSTAESYISAVDASAYHSLRGNTLWSTMSTNEQEQALRRATDYMGMAYSQAWQGRRVSSTQALDWPRVDVVVNGWYVDSNVIPVIVKNACAELAFKAAAGELLADQSQGVIREEVGPIKVEYDKSSPVNVRYKAIDALLSPYVTGGAGLGSANTRLIRS